MPLQKLVNFAKDTNFRFYCSELPLISELCQDVTLPTVTLGEAEVHTRFIDYPEPGEKLLFPELA